MKGRTQTKGVSNRVLRIFGPKKEVVVGKWIRLDN
jgi:hypothetical protein